MTPRARLAPRRRLRALWRELHDAQAAYVAAQLRVDQLSIPSFYGCLLDDPQHAAKAADERRNSVRTQLRDLYNTLFGEKGVMRFDAYVMAFDAMYGPSHRYSFVSRMGRDTRSAITERRLARRMVNNLTGTKVLR